MSFTESLLAEQTRPRVVAAVARAIDEEVAGKGGLSGMMLKGAYASVKAVKEGIVPTAIDAMLPELVRAVEPFWLGKGEHSFEQHLTTHRTEAANAILAISDAEMERSTNPALVRIYQGFRGKGRGYVEDALPRLARAIEPFVG